MKIKPPNIWWFHFYYLYLSYNQLKQITMSLEIANTIKQQLTYGRQNAIKVMSWGAHAWSGGDNFLIFKVQGHHFKGNVKITLNSMDTYDIEFFKPRGTEPVKTIEGMYNDQITEVIDEYVEKIKAYEF